MFQNLRNLLKNFRWINVSQRKKFQPCQSSSIVFKKKPRQQVAFKDLKQTVRLLFNTIFRNLSQCKFAGFSLLRKQRKTVHSECFLIQRKIDWSAESQLKFPTQIRKIHIIKITGLIKSRLFITFAEFIMFGTKSFLGIELATGISFDLFFLIELKEKNYVLCFCFND